MTTVKQILKKWLKQNGYDGLCNPDIECGCWLSDLMPCGDWLSDDCVAGHTGYGDYDGEPSVLLVFPGKKRKRGKK